MSKFAKTARPAHPPGVTKTTHATRTHEGGQGYALDERTELFTLALTSFIREDSFYESGTSRDNRLTSLVRSIASTPDGADWLAQFIPWVRHAANMRTASVVMAVEYARHAHAAASTSGRALLTATLGRADEPAEALAYHLEAYGRKLPASVKRGIADAAARLFNEYSVAKYDPANASVRLGDVIELTHPKPKDPTQAALFRYALDVRHGRKDPRVDELLTRTQALRAWHRAPSLEEIPALITWEQVSSHFPMDARAWEAVIPRMGYMALLRNLRNFEEARVSPAVLDEVARRLADPGEVARSQQLPFRFWNAYTNVSGTRFVHPLEVALDASVNNIPRFDGRTLILVDTSGSMQGGSYSKKGSLSPVQAASLFGAATAMRSEDPHVCIFATHAKWMERLGTSTLRLTERITKSVGSVGHGTEIDGSLRWALNAGHTYARIFIFTDMQAHPSHFRVADMVPKHVPIHVWDLAGHGRANIELGSGRYLHAGLSDQSFKTVQLLEAYRPGVWPWEAE